MNEYYVCRHKIHYCFNHYVYRQYIHSCYMIETLMNVLCIHMIKTLMNVSRQNIL
jgi:hypothetical protein